MSNNLVYVKLGGSVITDKQRPATARPEVIRRLAREMRDAVKELSKSKHERIQIIGKLLLRCFNGELTPKLLEEDLVRLVVIQVVQDRKEALKAAGAAVAAN